MPDSSNPRSVNRFDVLQERIDSLSREFRTFRNIMAGIYVSTVAPILVILLTSKR